MSGVRRDGGGQLGPGGEGEQVVARRPFAAAARAKPPRRHPLARDSAPRRALIQS